MADWLDLPEMVLDQSNHSDFLGAAELGAFLIKRPTTWTSAAEQTRRFFSLSDSEKLRSVSGSGTLGFRPVGVENLAVDAGESDDAPADRNESFAATWEDMAGGDRKFTWPELPGFREAWASFHRESAALGDRILPLLLDEPARRPEKDADHGHDQPGRSPAKQLPEVSAHFARAIRYPPVTTGHSWGAGEHSDFGWFSFIWADEGGLEVASPEGWRPVVIPEDWVVVILGDVATLATGYRLPATGSRPPGAGTHPNPARPGLLLQP